MTSLSSDNVNSFNFVLWGAALVAPFALAAISHTRGTSARGDYTWIIMYAFGLVGASLAAVGLNLSYFDIQPLYTSWVVAHVCGVLQPWALLVWAFTTRPLSGKLTLDWAGLIASLGLSVVTYAFLIQGKLDGAIVNFVPMGFYTTLVVWHVAALGLRAYQQHKLGSAKGVSAEESEEMTAFVRL